MFTVDYLYLLRRIEVFYNAQKLDVLQHLSAGVMDVVNGQPNDSELPDCFALMCHVFGNWSLPDDCCKMHMGNSSILWHL